METFFERMLEQHHGIHPRPAEFIRELVAQVFGKPSVNKVATMHLYLAPLGECSEGEREEDGASTKSVHSSSSSSLSKKAWMSIDWDWKDKKEPRPSGEMSGYSSPVPTFVSLKAASRLGIDVSPLNTPETMGVKSGSRLGMTTRLFIPRNQTPGLIFWPSTFLPMSPSELEMHVCRHMHVLLGCKASLAEFIAKFGDERGERFVGDKEFEDMIWDYEWYVPPVFYCSRF
jgi:hypothetical protein